MTQSTDQERAEYLSWISANYADIYSAEEAQMMWDHGHLSALAWKEQAARRAPAAPVPQGWKLVPVAPTSEMLGAADREHAARGLVSIALISYQAMLAAAPQPPEAAPVQLPEPFTSLVRKKSWSPNCYEASPLSRAKDYGRQWADERINVYTEQQVRDLLAAHGIGKDKA